MTRTHSIAVALQGIGTTGHSAFRRLSAAGLAVAAAGLLQLVGGASQPSAQAQTAQAETAQVTTEAAAGSVDQSSPSPLSAAAGAALVGPVQYALSFLDGPIDGADYSDPTTRIVVPGKALDASGHMSDRLIARLTLARSEALAHPTVPLVLTGGDTGTGFHEAEVMREWLVERGIDTSRITIEPDSWTTVSNAAFTHRLIPDATSLVLVAPDDNQRNVAADFAAVFGPGTTITVAGEVQPPLTGDARTKVIGDLLSWYLLPENVSTEGIPPLFGPTYGPPGRLPSRIGDLIDGLSS